MSRKKILLPLTKRHTHRQALALNLVSYFIERYLLTEEGLTAMNRAKPVGVPALISLYKKMSKDDALLGGLNASIETGEVMPNVPEMKRFFSSVGAAIQIATQGRASAEKALSDAAASMRDE